MRLQRESKAGGVLHLLLLVVDDHALLRQGLVSLLRDDPRIGKVEEAASREEALERLQTFQPDVILLDAWDDDSAGGAFLEAIARILPEPKIIVLSVAGSEQALLRAMRAGVKGFLDRGADAAQLVDGVMEVSRGEIFVSKRLVHKLVAQFAALAASDDGDGRVALATLTEREGQILQRVALGETNKTIAESLYLSEGTVRAHLRSIMTKLNVTNRVQAVTLALRNGLVDSTNGQGPPTDLSHTA